MSRRGGLFWRGYFGVYWLFVIGVGASVGISVTYRAFETPAPAAPSDALSESDCDARLMALFGDLRAHARDALQATDVAESTVVWRAFSTDWRARLATARSACRLPADPTRQSLARLADDLDRVHLAYTTALKGFRDVGKKPLDRIRGRATQ